MKTRTSYLKILFFLTFSALTTNCFSQLKIKAYGNWCGINHPYYNGPFAPVPVSDLDCACRDHDIDYTGSGYLGNLGEADRVLVNRCLAILNAGGMYHYESRFVYNRDWYGNIVQTPIWYTYRGANALVPFNIGWRSLSGYEKERLYFIVSEMYGQQFLNTFVERVKGTVHFTETVVSSSADFVKGSYHHPLKTPENATNMVKQVGRDAERQVRHTIKDLGSQGKTIYNSVKSLF